MRRLPWPAASLFCLLATAGIAEAQDAAVSPTEQRLCEAGTLLGSADCSAEKYLLEILDEAGVEKALAELDELAASDPNARRDAHGYAHAIGINAYRGTEPVGQVFARCTPAHQSGCYHGVIQSYFNEHTRLHGGHLEAQMVNELCREQRNDANKRWLLFQCAHGMGHGLVMQTARHLPTALGGCDLVSDPWERESCYGGVFMENIVHETVPHHAVGRPEEVHAGHTADAAAAPAAGGAPAVHVHAEPATAAAPPSDFPGLKADDPLYPCNALDQRYSIACYQMQTSAVLFFNGFNVQAAGVTCTTAPAQMQPTCFQSLGRDISSMVQQNHPEAIRLCGSVPDESQPWCHIGYAKNLIDLTAQSDDGVEYCRLLPASESKFACYRAVGEQIWVLTDVIERRAELCSIAERDYVNTCRRGAGLTEEAAMRSGGPRAPILNLAG